MTPPRWIHRITWHEPNTPTHTQHTAGTKQQEDTQTMGLDHVDALPLDYNVCVEACLNVFLNKKGRRRKRSY